MSRTKEQSSILPPPWITLLISIVLGVWLVMQLKEIVVLLVVAYALAYIIDPLLAGLEKRRVPRTFGFFIIIGGLVVGFFLLGVTAIPTLEREYLTLSANLPQYIEVARDRVEGLVTSFKDHLPARFLPAPTDDGATAALPGIPSGALEKVLRGATAALLSGYSLTLTILSLALLPFLTFYLAIDFAPLHRQALALFPVSARRRVREITLQIDGYVSAFVRGQFLIGTILFLLYGIGLWIVGVDLWLLLALIAGFGNIVPYLGFLAGIVLSSVMALVTFGDFAHVLQVWLVFAIVQGLEGTVITPRILGEKVGLSPLAVILALVVGGQLFGLLGVFLAVPAAAALRVLGGYLHGRLVG